MTYNKIWIKDTENVKVIDGLPNKNEAVIFNVQQTGNLYFHIRAILDMIKKISIARIFDE